MDEPKFNAKRTPGDLRFHDSWRLQKEVEATESTKQFPYMGRVVSTLFEYSHTK